MYPENILHHIPTGDMVRHETGRKECHCLPVVKLIPDGDDWIWYAKHNPVDNRDQTNSLSSGVMRIINW